MNAYELADELQDLHGLYCENAANMLRQQADRIAGLEKQLKHYKMAWNMAENTLEAQTKPLSDEEIYSLLDKCIEYTDDNDHAEFMYKKFARAIEERHGIK